MSLYRIYCALCEWIVRPTWRHLRPTGHWEGEFRITSISLQRLLDVCRSHPVLPHGHAPSWGHNYGGAAIVDKDQSFPWEEAQQYVAHDFTGPHMLFSEDPYHVPGVDRLITADSQQPSPMFT
ncbi:hypothetical protein VTH82DRAFT_6974 [Thermothelomyces myriococcoides]